MAITIHQVFNAISTKDWGKIITDNKEDWHNSLSIRQLLSTHDPLFVAEINNQGIHTDEIAKISMQDSLTGIGNQLVFVCKKIAHYAEARKQKNGIDFNDLLTKLLPSDKTALQTLISNIAFLKEHYLEHEILQTFTLLSETANKKLIILQDIQNRLEKAKESLINAKDNPTEETYEVKLNAINQQLTKFHENQAHSKDERFWASVEQQSANKLKKIIRLNNIYKNYRREEKLITSLTSELERNPKNDSNVTNLSNDLLQLASQIKSLKIDLVSTYDELSKQEYATDSVIEILPHVEGLELDVRALTPATEDMHLLQQHCCEFKNIRHTFQDLKDIKIRYDFYHQLLNLTYHWEHELSTQMIAKLYQNKSISLNSYINEKTGIIDIGAICIDSDKNGHPLQLFADHHKDFRSYIDKLECVDYLLATLQTDSSIKSSIHSYYDILTSKQHIKTLGDFSDLFYKQVYDLSTTAVELFGSFSKEASTSHTLTNYYNKIERFKQSLPPLNLPISVELKQSK